MALNPDKVGDFANGFGHLRELEMGVTPDQSPPCKGELSNPSSSNELLFGEEFEYVVSL